MEKDILASLLLWLHISGAITFSIGMVASLVITAFLASEKELKVIQGLTRLGHKFGRFMDIGGGLMLLAGFALAWREEEPMLGFLQGSDENWLLVSILLFLFSLPIVYFGYWRRERSAGIELEKALKKGKFSPGLQAALVDKRLRNGKIFEILTYAVIIFLMVVKPF